MTKQQGKLPVKTALTMACQLLEALEYAHGKGYVHRDIKPANLLVKETPKGAQGTLADFGLARVYQTSQLSGLTMSGEFAGTVPFMPPEQITHYRRVRPAGDQYSAAATLYYLLTGAFVHDFAAGDTMPLLVVLDKDPVPIDQRGVKLPAGLADVIHRALSREPKDRFADVSEMREELLQFT